jgi:transposase
VRFIGMDVHVDFCEVAIHAGGVTAKAPRLTTSEPGLRRFAQRLSPDDVVALEATGNAWAIARLVGAYARVIVADTRPLRALSAAKAKTDRADARALAELAAAGLLRAVWVADEDTRALRRMLARRQQLVRQRARAKNEVHAALHRNLVRSPVSDLFGVRGRAWLQALALPAYERHTVASCLRQVDLVEEELREIDRLVAERALTDARIRRLMTIPGVDMITAAALVGVIGEIERFPDPRKLVSYLGLDPTGASRATSPPATDGSPRRARRASGGSWSRRPGWRVAARGRCTPSTPACAPAGEDRSPPWPPPASSPCWPGICCGARRTMPTRGPRSPGSSFAAWSCARAPRPSPAAGPKCASTRPAPSERPSGPCSSRPRRPTSDW